MAPARLGQRLERSGVSNRGLVGLSCSKHRRRNTLVGGGKGGGTGQVLGEGPVCFHDRQ